MAEVLKISNDEVESLLTWDNTVGVVEQALIALSNTSDSGKRDKNILACIQTPRTFTQVPSGDLLICMPSYLQGLDLGYNKKDSALACKLLTVFEGNVKLQPPLPTIDGSVMLYDGDVGVMKAMIDADKLTLWRTAAVTCAATKALFPRTNNRILAIVGAGKQGRMHALAFANQFKFHKIRVWNRTRSKAEAVVNELKQIGVIAEVSNSTIECVQGADVIITTTFSPTPLIQDDWVKEGALINVIGVVHGGSEISLEIYKRAKVYVESKQDAQNELRGTRIEGTLGEVIQGKIPKPSTDKITIFKSLGSGVEDAAVGMLLCHLSTLPKNSTLQ